jgi:hypothetical protein
LDEHRGEFRVWRERQSQQLPLARDASAAIPQMQPNRVKKSKSEQTLNQEEQDQHTVRRPTDDLEDDYLR